jgi:hypothetical protein
MNIDVPAAVSFMATHGRLLDRRRLHRLLGEEDSAGVLDALDAYRNPDGGYGWGLEPDLRSAESQPTAAMHAFEVMAETGPVTTARAVELCDWLEKHTLADGGLPFALPVADPTGCAPFWVQADPTISALQMTTQVAANAHLAARHAPAVASHAWLRLATSHCVAAIQAVDSVPHAYELKFALQLLDAAAESLPDADTLFTHIGQFVPADGSMHVDGGTEDETLFPLDFAPYPDRPVRSLFDRDVVATDLERLARLQQPDGGWLVDFDSYSPAAALEWRGYATVRAVSILQRNAT